jgi:hypothetical protein
MNGALLIPAVIIALWILLSLIIGYQDHRDRRARDLHLELRAWQQKVDAMRRMADQEGDA